MMKRHLLLFALVLLPRSGAAAQQVADFIHLPAARLEAAVRAASVAAPAPLLVNTMEQRDDHASIMVRRTESSAPELHEEFDDLYIVEQGTAVLVYGGNYEGRRRLSPASGAAERSQAGNARRWPRATSSRYPRTSPTR